MADGDRRQVWCRHAGTGGEARRKLTAREEGGKPPLVLGLRFISGRCTQFAARDPMRSVLPRLHRGAGADWRQPAGAKCRHRTVGPSSSYETRRDHAGIGHLQLPLLPAARWWRVWPMPLLKPSGRSSESSVSGCGRAARGNLPPCNIDARKENDRLIFMNLFAFYLYKPETHSRLFPQGQINPCPF